MPITIKDVAKYANVSPSTVSRVISNSPKISVATKERVRSALEELEYHPNQIARSLTNRSTKTIGLILPGTNEDFLLNPFFVKAIRGICTYAKTQGYYILFTHAEKDDDDITVLDDLVNSKWVDGIILSTIKTDDKRVQFLKKRNHPFVIIGKPHNADNLLWVDNDNVQAMFNVVDMLIKKGNKSIAFIGGSHEFQVTKDRLLGYLKALKANNIPVDLNLIQEKDYTEEGAYEAATEITKYLVPDAIVTTDDLIAFGAQKVLLEQHLDHVSLVGFNNTLLAQHKTPAISSVDINAEKLGMFATKLLIATILNQPIETTNYIIDTKLIVRDSIKDINSHYDLFSKKAN